jgi:predicted DNA-binding transcriptional regulator YafY
VRDAEGRNAQLVRCLQVIEALCQRDMTAQELAAEFGVDRRTLYRDLDAIERSGAIVTLVRKKHERPCRYRALLSVGPDVESKQRKDT